MIYARARTKQNCRLCPWPVALAKRGCIIPRSKKRPSQLQCRTPPVSSVLVLAFVLSQPRWAPQHHLFSSPPLPPCSDWLPGAPHRLPLATCPREMWELPNGGGRSAFLHRRRRSGIVRCPAPLVSWGLDPFHPLYRAMYIYQRGVYFIVVVCVTLSATTPLPHTHTSHT